MIGPITLGLHHAAHHRTRTLVLILCVAAATALPAAVSVLTARFRETLTARADQTPLVVGPRASRFDLAMGLLYFRRTATPTISMADADAVSAQRPGVVIPLNLASTARGRTIIATTPEYLELRRLRPAAGTAPLLAGDALLGGRFAREIGAAVGDRLFSDQREVFDIARPAALRMRVVGILPETGVPEDDAAIVTLETAWILDGLSHAHTEPGKVPERLVLERRPESVAISEELIDFNEVTPENAASFHLHAERAQLPLTGLIVVPATPKDGTMLASRINAGRALQAVAPAEVVTDLLAYVFRVRSALQAVSLLVGGLTAVLLALVTALSVEVRRRELETLRRIGVSRSAVGVMFAAELAAILVSGALLGALLAASAAGLTHHLMKLL